MQENGQSAAKAQQSHSGPVKLWDLQVNQAIAVAQVSRLLLWVTLYHHVIA